MVVDPAIRRRRVAAVSRRRRAGLRARLARPGGHRRRRVLAVAHLRRDRVDASWPRTLPGEGGRAGRHVRGAHGSVHRYRAAGSAARCTSPMSHEASSVPTASSARACPSRPASRRRCGRVAPTTWWWRSSATARSRTGAFHEAMNLAGLWRLPILFVCENNHYAEFTETATQHRAPVVRARPCIRFRRCAAIDGNDVVAVARRHVISSSAAPPVRPISRRGRHLSLAWALRRRSSSIPRPDVHADAARVRSGRARARSCSSASGWQMRDEAVDAVGRRRDRECDRRCRGRRLRPGMPTHRVRHLSTPSRRRGARRGPRCRRRSAVPRHGRGARGVADRARGQRRRLGGRHRRRRRRQHLRRHARLVESLSAPRVLDTPISETAIVGLAVGGGDGRHPAGGRDHVHGLHRRVPRRHHEPGGQAAVHDRRRRHHAARRSERRSAPVDRRGRSTRRASRRCSRTSPGWSW